MDGLSYFIGWVGEVTLSYIFDSCNYGRVSLAHTRPTFCTLPPGFYPSRITCPPSRVITASPPSRWPSPCSHPLCWGCTFTCSTTASSRQTSSVKAVVKVNEEGRGWFMANPALASAPSGCRGQCQSSIKQLLVKFIFMALVRPLPGRLFQPDSVPRSCRTIGMKEPWWESSWHCPKCIRDTEGRLVKEGLSKSKQMPSLVSDGLLETERFGHSKDLWPMKYDHVVKVVVLKKPDTAFSSISGRINPLVLVKSQILGSDLTTITVR